LQPGRYVHRVISADVFCLRVKRNGKVYTKVLSAVPPEARNSSTMASWDWSLPLSSGTFYALYPRSWTVYENPVPGVTVVVEQVSPFLPDSYSEASLPCATFHVSVTNTDPSYGAEVSVMFCFQNGYEGGAHCTACGPGSGANTCCVCAPTPHSGDHGEYSGYGDSLGGLTHAAFSLQRDAPAQDDPSGLLQSQVVGVCMARPCSVATSLATHPVGHKCPNCGRVVEQRGTAGAGILSTLLATLPTDLITPAAPDTPETAMPAPASSCPRCSSTGLASYTIAALQLPHCDGSFSNGGAERAPKISTCAQYVTDTVSLPYSLLQYMCGGAGQQHADPGASARQLWEAFESTGDITDSEACRSGVSLPGTRVGAAVCVRQWLGPASDHAAGSGSNNTKLFPFSLSWDDPLVQFGTKATSATSPFYPRFYTRFFGGSGLASPRMAAYALLHVDNWRERIIKWQQATLQRTGAIAQFQEDLREQLDDQEESAPAHMESDRAFYDALLFNELYFLADGGTLWLDSTAGYSNQQLTAVGQMQAAAAQDNRIPAYDSTKEETEVSGGLNRKGFGTGNRSDDGLLDDELLEPLQGTLRSGVPTNGSSCSYRLLVFVLSSE
jgi:hypothetical protein